MKPLSLLLILAGLANVHCAPPGNRDEIRYDRMEAFGRTASSLIIRPDSVLLKKYTTHPKDDGDTIGSFRVPSTRKRFDSLWTLLMKGESAKGIPPDTKVLVIEGRKGGKVIEFVVPVHPPMPEWARSFGHRIGDLQTLAEREPYSSVALKEKIEAKSGATVLESLWLANPGMAAYTRTGKCAVTFEGARLDAKGGTRAMKWTALADTVFPRGISLEPRKPVLIGFGPKPSVAGKWYFRAKWVCEPEPNAVENTFREEVFSPLDSLEVGRD